MSPDAAPKWPQAVTDLEPNSPLRVGIRNYLATRSREDITVVDSATKAKNQVELTKALADASEDVRRTVDFLLRVVRDTDLSPSEADEVEAVALPEAVSEEEPKDRKALLQELYTLYLSPHSGKVSLNVAEDDIQDILSPQKLSSDRHDYHEAVNMWLIRRSFPRLMEIEEQVSRAQAQPEWKRAGAVHGSKEWSLDDYLSILRTRNGIGKTHATQPEGRIDGGMVYRLNTNEIRLDNVVVDPEARGKGVAESMMADLLIKASHRQSNRATIAPWPADSEEQNKPLYGSTDRVSHAKLSSFVRGLQETELHADAIDACKAALIANLHRLPEGALQTEYARVFAPILSARNDQPEVFARLLEDVSITLQSLSYLQQDFNWFVQHGVKLDDLEQTDESSAVSEVRTFNAEEQMAVRRLLGNSPLMTVGDEDDLGFTWHAAIAPNGDAVGHLQMAESEDTETLQVRRFAAPVYSYCGPCSQQVYARLLTQALKALNDNPKLRSLVSVAPVRFPSDDAKAVSYEKMNKGDATPQMAARFRDSARGANQFFRIAPLMAPREVPSATEESDE